MSNGYFDQSITGFSQSLRNLSAILDLAKTHAETHNFDLGNLLSARLYPDMLTCTRQVQIATDFAKGAAARLAGIAVPQWEDTEITADELQARIRKALDFLGTFQASQFADAATRAIELKTPVGIFNFTGQTFLLHWAVPNFYFHYTTAYNLLRHNGVAVGKFDFLGKV